MGLLNEPPRPALFPSLFCKEACDEREIARLKRLAGQFHLCSDQTIFSKGELADSAFGLSRGLVRLYKRLPDGRRQVVSFALPSDLLNTPLDDRFRYSADAIGEVSVCRFPREQLKSLILSSQNLMRLLLESTRRELRRAEDQMLLLGSGSAEERLTNFLLNWRSHLGRPSAEPVPLPMRRQDIADFLGLQLETVSRTFAKLEKKGALRFMPAGVLLMGLELAAMGTVERRRPPLTTRWSSA